MLILNQKGDWQIDTECVAVIVRMDELADGTTGIVAIVGDTHFLLGAYDAGRVRDIFAKMVVLSKFTLASDCRLPER